MRPHMSATLGEIDSLQIILISNSTYLRLDIMRRLLEHFGDVQVFQVMNITDVEDKIIARAQESGIDPIVLFLE